MEGLIYVGIAFVLMFVLLALGVPIAFCILCGAIVGLQLLGGFNTVTSLFGYSLHVLMASYPLAVAPLFILIGTLADVSGLGEVAYFALHRLVGSVRGGLLIATTGAAALFGACSGSSVASTALFSKIALPELRKLGHQEEISLGCIATAGGLAVLIPPSVAMVLFGLLTGESIGKLLIGGLLPGITLTAILMGFIHMRVRLNPKLAPVGGVRATWREKRLAVISVWPLIVVFSVIIGGIYFGWSTPTEAGALGASVVLVYALSRRIGLRKVLHAFTNALRTTGQIFILVAAGMLLSKAVALGGVTQVFLLWLETSQFPVAVVWAIFILICLGLGAILDPVSMMVLTLPISYPVLMELGVNPIALGVIVVLLNEVAVITPPIGFNVYVVSALGQVDPAVGFRGVTPFFFVLMFMIILVIVFPSIASWLPSVAFG